MIWPAVVPSPRHGRRIGYVMCMQPAAWPEPEPRIAAAIAAKYRGRRPRPLAVLIRDQLGEWLGDEDFAAAFGPRWPVPGWSRWRWTRCWGSWRLRAWSRRAGSSAPIPPASPRRWRP